MTTEADKLREELKNGRTQTVSDAGQTANGTGADSQGIGGSDHRTEQSVPSDLFGPGAENDSTNESYDDSERGSDKITVGVGRTDRRSSKSSGSSSDRTETIRGAKRRSGRLVADDPIPFREKAKASAKPRSTTIETELTVKEEKSIPIQRGKTTGKTGTPVVERKDEKQGFKFPGFKEGSTLSIAEAKALEEPLIAALSSDFDYVDQYLWYKTRDTTQAPIWSNVDDDEIRMICQPLLKRAQKSPAAAATVRNIVNMSTNIDIAMILAPRVIKTFQVLKEAPKIERPGFMERKRIVRENA